MRKLFVIALLTALLMLGATACAEDYAFNRVFMSLSLPGNVYETQLTPENLESKADEVQRLGYTVEGLKATFAQDGVLLMAFDQDNDRVFVVTAVRDDRAVELYDINEQTADVRATYRVNHSNGTYCSSLGYKFESCEWKNFGGEQGRFLMLKYVHRNNGKVDHKGLWRRTIRNGYTITLDMRTSGRNVTTGDITALNKIQDSVSFTAITGMPEAPITMAFTAPPPSITNDASFTIKGSTQPGATVRAAFFSFRKADRVTVVTTTADNKGIFKLDVTLPAQDLYNAIVTSTVRAGTETEETTEQTFSIEYDESLLPISFTSDFPEVFTSDSFKFTGATITGVTVQVNVNGVNTVKKTGNNRTFSFTVDTSKEGTYDIHVTFSKKGYDTRLFNYKIERVMNEDERRAQIRAQAITPEYAKLKNKTDSYKGKTVDFKGYITNVQEIGGQWVATFATKKSGNTFSSIIMVLSNQPITAAQGEQLTLYGTVNGQYKAMDENGKNVVYPRADLLFFE